MVESSIIALFITVAGLIFTAGVVYNKLSNAIKLLGGQQSIVAKALQSLIASLCKSNTIKAADLLSILDKTFPSDSINKTLQSISGGTSNPVSREEALMLEQYLVKARRNEPFTQQEARDFYTLSQKVFQDRSQDEGALSILIIASAIFAFYVVCP